MITQQYSGAEVGSYCAPRCYGQPTSNPIVDNKDAGAGKQTAVLSGGCFWCVEVVYQQIAGVERWSPDYSAVTLRQLTTTWSVRDHGHAESVQVTYDPRKVSYGQILKVFFHVAHDPTQLKPARPDRGHNTIAIF